MVKNTVRVFLMSGVIAVFTTALPAPQAVEQEGLRASHQEPSIVGAWMGTVDNGERILMSFTSDGIVLGSIQGEAKLTLPVLTPSHGAWAHLGGRRFAFTSKGILYDIQTGEDRGFGKIRAALTLDRDGDQMSVTVEVSVFAPDGNLVVTFPHTVRLTRIKVEPFD
jgi:hypothetical protein